MPLLEYGYDSPQFGTVLLSLVAAFLSLFMAGRPVSARKTGARAVSLALLAALSTLFGGPLTLTVGLLAFAFGDALLVQDDRRALQAGFVCLAAGQVSYVLMLLPFVDLAFVTMHPLRLLPVAFAVVALVFAFLRSRNIEPDSRLLALLYLVTAMGTGIVAVASPREGIAIGCLLLMPYAFFVVVLRRIGAPSVSHETVGWAIFYCAQLAITLSALALL